MMLPPTEEFLQVLGTWVFFLCLPALVLFVFFYGIQSNWRAHRIGRALFWMTFSMVVVCCLSLLTLFFDDWFLKPYVRVVAYGFVTITIWRMFFELRRIQKNSGEDPRYESLLDQEGTLK